MADARARVRSRAIIQWSLVPLVFITIGLGWRWPLVGFVVPVVMVMGIVGGVFNGRYVCGNLCPRGSFFDRVISPVSLKRPVPQYFRNMAFRWTALAALMGFMAWRLSQDIGNVYHWGRVFWLMCTVTTGIGVMLGLTIHPRSWCSFCPIGTAANALGGQKNQLQIDSEICRQCRVCEKSCPIALDIVKHKAGGVVAERDCVRCDECVAKCPVKALKWPDAA